MGKEGFSSLLIDRHGRINVAFIFSFIFILIVMMWVANALSITLKSPGNLTYNASRNINFTFNVTWSNQLENVSNCTLGINSTRWGEILLNFSVAEDNNVSNQSISWVNFTFSSDGNYTYNIGCYSHNLTSPQLNFSGGEGGSGNRTFLIDTVDPQLATLNPLGLFTDSGDYNITSYETAVFYINVTDNSTRNVFLILNSNASVFGSGVNESVNRTMTINATLTQDKQVYRFNLSGLLDFNSSFTGPGPRSVFFCANDSLGRQTCTGKRDFSIYGANITQIENIFTTMEHNNPDAGQAPLFKFGGLNITYGNGTEVPEGSFLNPVTGGNFTFIINFSSRVMVYIVGARINASTFGDAGKTNYSDVMTSQVQQEVGSGFKSNMTFLDVASFIPSDALYEFGIIRLPDKFEKVQYCNGTSVANPNCFPINACNASAFNIFNHTSVIPSRSACFISSSADAASWSVSTDETSLAKGYTYLFVDKFSGGLGSNDFSQVNVTMNTPTASITNSSSALTQNINFTLDDVNSTGLNLTSNNSINVTIIQGGTQIRLFGYINQSNSTNLTCTTTDTTSPENTTSVTCNVTFAFNSNSSYLINITGRDTSNVSNAVNVTQSSFNIIIDQIAPRIAFRNNQPVLNFSNASAQDGSGILGGSTPSAVPSSGDGTWAQGRRLFGFANFTDNLTKPFEANLQFFNATSSSWQTINTTTNLEDVNLSNVATGANVTANLSFVIPSGRSKEFEGKNVSFRIIVNDTVGNVNSSASVANITIQINDTFFDPVISINGTLVVNGSNLTNTRPLISWNITTENDVDLLIFINVSLDRAVAGGNSDGCGKYRFFDESTGAFNGQRNRNGSFQVESADTDPTCPLGNGTHVLTITVKDSWGNSKVVEHNFSIQAGTTPGLVLGNFTNENRNKDWNKSSIGSTNGISGNATNITSFVGLEFFGFGNSNGISVDRLTYLSSCNTSDTVVFNNNTVVFPFNKSSCNTLSANRTLTVTINDTAGNSNTTLFQFLVDNVAPTITVISSPTNGQSFTNENISLNLSVRDNDQAITFVGYYLDDRRDPFTINISEYGQLAGPGVNATFGKLVNHTGTHTIKFTANDSLGNVVNSSAITVTMAGPVDLLGANRTIFTNNAGNVSNLTFLDANNNNIVAVSSSEVNQTLKLIVELNETAVRGANLTISFNGSAANWNKTDKIRFIVNDSIIASGIRDNLTATVIQSVMVNGSISEFLADNNSYFGKVTFGMNANLNPLGGKRKLYYFADQTNLGTQINVTECTAGFNPTPTQALSEGTFPCWNNTNNRTVDIFVPHFSVVVFANDSDAPTINVTVPGNFSNVTLSMFVPNITVSPDAVSCKFIVNGSTANETMAKSGNICLGSTQRFKNLPGTGDLSYNINFTVEDSGGNINNYVVNFNVTDNTPPNIPNATRVSVGSITATSATITISDINESVNASVQSNGSKSFTTGVQTDFNQTQAVSLSSLSASTTYTFNVTVCDFAGNCAENSTGFSFTTSAADSGTTTTTTTTTSGGGGGGDGETESAKVVDSKTQVWSNVPAGASVSLEVNKEKIAITEVTVSNVKSALSNVEIEVAALSKNPVSQEPASKVYQYLRITKENVKDNDATSLAINFRVTKSWLTENGLASGDIVLYRYDSKWNELVTSVTGTDETYVNYEADTPGFSSFAIGVKTGAVKEEEEEEGKTEEVPEEEEKPGEEVKPPEKVEEPKPIEAPSKAPIAWIIAAIVVVLGIVLIVVYQKSKKKV